MKQNYDTYYYYYYYLCLLLLSCYSTLYCVIVYCTILYHITSHLFCTVDFRHFIVFFWAETLAH